MAHLVLKDGKTYCVEDNGAEWLYSEDDLITPKPEVENGAT